MGRFDLKIESRILRSELKRPKSFVHHLKSLMTTFPECALSSKEKYDIVNSGMESGAGRIFGWCYSSVLDITNWRVVEINHGLKDACFKNLKAICRYQLLPFGATVDSAASIIDFYNVPKGFLEFSQQLSQPDGKEMN
uniref:Uncharacterized protein n=1 Tax=Aplanochytrium stocchinoi TaxID=215587 RepID=A0A7S3PN87_9STRA|mmetsp:Transcript_9583/g.10929  ORF Transcript_9583/g.10929 Transcript_9583/m.10929 type:complete len:138 (+) Transcript_9583:308-721(+)